MRIVGVYPHVYLEKRAHLPLSWWMRSFFCTCTECPSRPRFRSHLISITNSYTISMAQPHGVAAMRIDSTMKICHPHVLGVRECLYTNINLHFMLQRPLNSLFTTKSVRSRPSKSINLWLWQQQQPNSNHNNSSNKHTYTRHQNSRKRRRK